MPQAHLHGPGRAAGRGWCLTSTPHALVFQPSGEAALGRGCTHPKRTHVRRPRPGPGWFCNVKRVQGHPEGRCPKTRERQQGIPSSAGRRARHGSPAAACCQDRAQRGPGWGGGPADLALSPAQAEARPTGETGAPAARGSICKGGWLLPSVSSRPTQTPAAGMLAWKRSLGPLGPVLTGFGDGQGGSYALGKRI